MIHPLKWTKRRKPAKLTGSPVDRARAYAHERDLTLLACLHDEAGDFVALMANHVVDTNQLGDIPDDSSAVRAIGFRDGEPPAYLDSFPTAMAATQRYLALMNEQEAAGFRASMMFADARWLLGAFPLLRDAKDILPLIDPSALDSPVWLDERRREQLLGLAISLGGHAYNKIALHPRIKDVKPYVEGMQALTSRYYGTAAPE